MTQFGRSSEEARAGATMVILAGDPRNRLLRSDGPAPPPDWAARRIARILPSNPEAPFVREAVERWLERAPGGPLDIDSEQGALAIPSLSWGWSAGIVHAISSGQRTLLELSQILNTVPIEKLIGLLHALRSAELVEVEVHGGDDDVYRITDWLRAGIAPLIAAARFEHRHAAAETPPIDRWDVEAGYLMALALVRLPAAARGLCRLTIDVPVTGVPTPTGVMARVADGGVASCSTELAEECDAALGGPPMGWLDALIDPAEDRLLERGGEVELVDAVLQGLHEALFGSESRGTL